MWILINLLFLTSTNSISAIVYNDDVVIEPISSSTPVQDKNSKAIILKDRAITESKKGDSKSAISYILEYIEATGDMSVINDHIFEDISSDSQFKSLKDRYKPTFSFISFLYLFAGLVGVFIFVMLNLKRNTDRTSRVLISLFILLHSIFLLHRFLYVANLQYYFPHILFISTTFSFLYGPILYFYFKRITYDYKFKIIDVLHLIPAIALLSYIYPFYAMTEHDKFIVIFNESNSLIPEAYSRIIIGCKVVSLSVYAFLVYKMQRDKVNLYKNTEKQRSKFIWQKMLLMVYVTYTITYLFYIMSLIGVFKSPLIMHAQVIVMMLLVFYVSYMIYVKPDVFEGTITMASPTNFFKYKKSGLTKVHSNELKAELLRLLDEEHVYKDNSLNLESLALKLNTNKHNTSQVINEHFQMSFFELINRYRINEAKDIMKQDVNHNLNIIDIAYEVGYNNKVTFNKSFKKQMSLTPTEYIQTLKK